MKARRKRILVYVLGSILLGFIVLTIGISLFPNSVFDREFSAEIQEHQNPILDLLMKGISIAGYVPVAVTMVLGSSSIFLYFKRKREALFITLTFLSAILGQIVKILVDRPRPTDSVVRIVEIAKHQSFPSGHVLFYVVFFGFIAVLMNHLKFITRSVRITIAAICMFMIFTIPISRIYLGAHWFTDVLGGFLLGILTLFVLSYFYMKKPNPSQL